MAFKIDENGFLYSNKDEEKGKDTEIKVSWLMWAGLGTAVVGIFSFFGFGKDKKK